MLSALILAACVPGQFFAPPPPLANPAPDGVAIAWGDRPAQPAQFPNAPDATGLPPNPGKGQPYGIPPSKQQPPYGIPNPPPKSPPLGVPPVYPNPQTPNYGIPPIYPTPQTYGTPQGYSAPPSCPPCPQTYGYAPPDEPAPQVTRTGLFPNWSAKRKIKIKKTTGIPPANMDARKIKIKNSSFAT